MNGQKLRSIREQYGLTRRQVEDATGISQANIARLENGSGARIETVRKLADFYGVPIEELLSD